MSTFDEKYRIYLEHFEDELLNYVNSLQVDGILLEAIKYSLLAGGKRVRPILLYAACDNLGVSISQADTFALAVEMIHTYSLIHDDLPAMDNDDFRRGKPSSHKMFGEAVAILAGDALLNQAYELIFSCLKTEKDIKAGKILATYAGSNGMIDGQVQDILCGNEEAFSEKNLSYIIENKTAKLIKAPLLIASALSSDKYYKELEEFGENLGFLFQLTDDILDVESTLEELGKTAHKDDANNKFNSIKYYGLKGVKDKAAIYYENCQLALNKIPNSKFLCEFSEKIYKRTH